MYKTGKESAPKSDISGSADYAHEYEQAEVFCNDVGGGKYQFVPQSQGIEGYWTPPGGGEQVGVSFKDLRGTSKVENIRDEVVRNYNQCATGGHNGAILHIRTSLKRADVIQYDKEAKPSKDFKSYTGDWFFSKIIFNCPDGIVEFSDGKLV